MTIEIIKLVFSGVTCISVMIGIYNIIQKNRVAIRENKVKRFISRRNQVGIGRSSSTSKYFEKYKQAYSNEALKDSKGLIIKKEWNSPIIDLDNVEVNIVTVDRKVNVPILSIFPMHSKKWPYTANIIKYRNDEPNGSKQYLFNGALYALQDMNTHNGKVSLNVYKTDYFSFVNTCLVLELEAEMNSEHYRNKLNLFDLTNRYAGIGINTITIFKNVLNDDGELKDYFLLHQRSKNLSEGQGLVHCVPAGSYQPIHSIGGEEVGLAFDKKLKNNAYREFCEEIFHVEKMHELGSVKLLTQCPEYRFLDFLGVNKFLGLGIEPYNTKVEVLTALYLDMSNESIDRLFKEAKRVNNVKYTKFIEKNCSKPFTYSMLESLLKTKFIPDVDDIFNEGKIIICEYCPEVLEQYYSQTNITQSLKEIFGRLLLDSDDFK